MTVDMYLVTTEGQQFLAVPSTDVPVLPVPGLPGTPGPSGSPGAEGPPGVGFRVLNRTFATPLTVWVWTHNLGTTAIEVQTFDSDGITEKEGDVSFPDANTVRIEWYYPEAGIARLLY